MIAKPNSTDAPAYCQPYFDLVTSNDLIQALEDSRRTTIELFNAIPVGKEDVAYAPDKWSVKEVLRHIIDCERVYSYRAFRFSRLDTTLLAGFDEDAYIANSRTIDESLPQLLEGYGAVRKSTIYLFRHMTGPMLDFKGNANGVVFTARALGYMAVGHNLHHCHTVNSLYGPLFH